MTRVNAAIQEKMRSATQEIESRHTDFATLEVTMAAAMIWNVASMGTSAASVRIRDSRVPGMHVSAQIATNKNPYEMLPNMTSTAPGEARMWFSCPDETLHAAAVKARKLSTKSKECKRIRIDM